MLKRLGLALAITTLTACGAPAFAAPANNSYNVGVCDPSYGQRCIKPNADGSINVSGAGGTSGAKATAAAPSLVEGSTNILSADLHGSNRTTLLDSAGVAVDLSTGVTSTNASGTVATGGTFQSVISASSTRKGCTIQNPTTATEALYVFFGANGSATTSNSFSLPAGAAISCANGSGWVLTDNVSVTGATTSHAFVVSYQ